MISPISIVLALLFAALVATMGINISRLRKDTEENLDRNRRRLGEKKSTEFLDRNSVDDTCDICFGEFENGRVYVCGCGMKFHEECVKMTEECPYCKAGIGTMESREIKKARCPHCGKILEKNVCPRCNTVLPNRDMRFECVCGETVYAGDGRCDSCGATYEFRYDSPAKR